MNAKKVDLPLTTSVTYMYVCIIVNTASPCKVGGLDLKKNKQN